jgi:hypothetical protein
MLLSFPTSQLMLCIVAAARFAGAAAGGSDDAESQSMTSVDEAAGLDGVALDLGLARASIKHPRAARLCYEPGNGAETLCLS